MILNRKAFSSFIYDVTPTLVSPSTEGAIDELRVVSGLTSDAAGLATSETSSTDEAIMNETD
jgi:hypothetical protein